MDNVITIRKLYMLLGLSTLFGNVVVADGFETAVRAYAAGNYKTALRILLPLAEQGHADAQFRLGMMFDNGFDLPQDPAQAEYWYNKTCPVPVTDPEQTKTTGKGPTTQ